MCQGTHVRKQHDQARFTWEGLGLGVGRYSIQVNHGVIGNSGVGSQQRVGFSSTKQAKLGSWVTSDGVSTP